MIATAIIGILAVLFAYMARFKFVQFGLKISFTLIFLFLAVRYNFGNDYKGYLLDFKEVNSFLQIDYFNMAYFHYEPGWLLLCRLFKPFGFFTMTAVLALFTCIVYYRFIKRYVQRKHYWLAVFLYIFTPGFLLIQSSAMRQSVAISIFIISIDYILKRRPIRFFLLIFLASLFHTSALILFPVYLLSYFNWEIGKKGILIIISIFISLFTFTKLLGSFINQFVSNYFEKYEVYHDPSVVNSGFGIIYFSILLFLILYYERFQNEKTGLMFKLAIINFIFIPLSIAILIIGRVAMYFAPATIIVYPAIQMYLKKPSYKFVFIASLVFITLFGFISFFQSNIWKDAFGTYRTIFSAPEWQ